MFSNSDQNTFTCKTPRRLPIRSRYANDIYVYMYDIYESKNYSKILIPLEFLHFFELRITINYVVDFNFDL
jgi:hypothetical protein